MADIYHPATRQHVRVIDSAVPSLRRGGWMLLSEWAEQAAADERALAGWDDNGGAPAAGRREPGISKDTGPVKGEEKKP